MENFSSSMAEDSTLSQDVIFQNISTTPLPEVIAQVEIISVWKSAAIIFLGVAFVILSVGGNFLVILAYLKEKSIQTPSNSNLVALAVVDFLIGILTIPFGFIYNLQGRWIFNINFCQFWLTTCYSLSSISSGHLVLIALDRYRILFQGMGYLQRRTLGNVFESVFFVWFIGIWITLPILVDWENVSLDPLVKKHCIAKKTMTWVIMTNLTVFILPGSLMVRIYFKIFQELKRRLKEKSAAKIIHPSPQPSSSNNANAGNGQIPSSFVFKSDGESDGEMLSLPQDCFVSVVERVRRGKDKINLERERRAAFTLGVLIGAFVFCWGPFAILTTIQAFNPNIKLPKYISVICASLGWVNSCVNPLVYVIRNQDFQSAFRKMFSTCKIK